MTFPNFYAADVLNWMNLVGFCLGNLTAHGSKNHRACYFHEMKKNRFNFFAQEIW